MDHGIVLMEDLLWLKYASQSLLLNPKRKNMICELLITKLSGSIFYYIISIVSYVSWQKHNLFSIFFKERLTAKILSFFFKDGLTIIKYGSHSIIRTLSKIAGYYSLTSLIHQSHNLKSNGVKTSLWLFKEWNVHSKLLVLINIRKKWLLLMIGDVSTSTSLTK